MQSFGRSTYVSVRNCTFIHCRTGPDFTGHIPCRYGLVDGCSVNTDSTLYAAADGRGMGTHGGAEFITFSNNTIGYVWLGIFIRGSNCTVQNNKFIGPIKACVRIQFGKDIYVNGNVALASQPRKTDTETVTPDYFFEVVDDITGTENLTATGIIDVGNNVGRVSVAFIYLQHDQGTSYDTLYVHNNRVELSNSGGSDDVSFILGDSGNTSLVGQTVIRDNIITVVDGTYVYLRDVVLWPRWCDGIDDLVMTDTTILADDGGGGALANTALKLNVSVNDGMAHVVGYVSFDVITAGTSLWISNLPTPYSTPKSLLVDNTGNQKLCHVTQTKWQIGDSTSDYTSDFAIGTGYVLWIDVHYHVDLYP